MAQDIRSVVDDIITTYELRIKEIGDKLKEKGTQLIDYFRNERTNLTHELESILAKKIIYVKKTLD
ncbi:MAG: hypothetical protein QMD71_02050 [bacterium]|nr:hypothetical protein [bacterium]